MALYQINISYDGSDYHGYQRQKDQRTVQREIENALKKTGWLEDSIISAGRTDAGVHADEQIAVFHHEWEHTPNQMKKAINAYLPHDIVVVDLKKICDNDFHPRYQAQSRIYRYQMYSNEIRVPILERFYWRVWPDPDIQKMNNGAKELCGNHNFRLFGKPYKPDGRTERIVWYAMWKREDGSPPILTFRIEANSFLYHMVRRIVFILIRVGQGKIKLSEVTNALEGIDNLPPGIAPAKGLFLEKIKY